MTLHFTALFWQTSELSISVNISSALWLLEFLIGSEFRIYLTVVWFEPKYNWMNLFLKVWAKKQWDEPFSQWEILFLCNTVFPEINMTDYEFDPRIQDLFCRESSLSQEIGWNAFWRSILISILSCPSSHYIFLFNFCFIIITIVFCCIAAWIEPDISGCQQDFLVVWRWNQLRTF